ncbi:hypothetical protein F0U44_09845 [Nocardioides humilatus]|uniref:Uncharacterized protein n=1 Tax=Nocardioides humilatus TaxID=2607660 RepID=A0A5B1LDG8_9ACTN|nr:hypothetical protein [Nocardioides humilatus]KAA1418783.1 hypothetical protein F0U44_09845 [Nocardioides humilatus]
MRRFFRDTFSPTMAVAILALVVATSGSGYAAIQLGRDDGASRAGAAAQPVLQPGKTMVGYFTAAGSGGASGYLGDSITFPAKLPAGFNNNHVKYLVTGAPFTDKCPGPGTAKRGWMCFYEGQFQNTSLCCIYDLEYNSFAVADHGARIYWDTNADGGYVDGQWVVRAP